MPESEECDALSALDHASVADGALLDAMDQSVWVFREDQSMHPTAGIADVRYMEFEVFEVKPGMKGTGTRL